MSASQTEDIKFLSFATAFQPLSARLLTSCRMPITVRDFDANEVKAWRGIVYVRITNESISVKPMKKGVTRFPVSPISAAIPSNLSALRPVFLQA